MELRLLVGALLALGLKPVGKATLVAGNVDVDVHRGRVLEHAQVPAELLKRVELAVQLHPDRPAVLRRGLGHLGNRRLLFWRREEVCRGLEQGDEDCAQLSSDCLNPEPHRLLLLGDKRTSAGAYPTSLLSQKATSSS